LDRRLHLELLGSIKAQGNPRRFSIVRDVQGPRQPIPNGKRETEIPSEMLWIIAVVDHVHGGADKHCAYNGRKRYPNMRMLQVISANRVMQNEKHIQCKKIGIHISIDI